MQIRHSQVESLRQAAQAATRATVFSFQIYHGGIAQLVERLLCTQDVRSSNLLTSTSLTMVKSVTLFLSDETLQSKAD